MPLVYGESMLPSVYNHIVMTVYCRKNDAGIIDSRYRDVYQSCSEAFYHSR